MRNHKSGSTQAEPGVLLCTARDSSLMLDSFLGSFFGQVCCNLHSHERDDTAKPSLKAEEEKAKEECQNKGLFFLNRRRETNN